MTEALEWRIKRGELGLRRKLEAALTKPVQSSDGFINPEEFNPWEDIIQGIYGGYSSECDRLMIAALEAVRDGTTFEFFQTKEGFAGEFMLYVLAGHGMLEYGTSPRGGWPDPSIKDLWQPLIDKWKEYSVSQWGE